MSALALPDPAVVFADTGLFFGGDVDDKSPRLLAVPLPTCRERVSVREKEAAAHRAAVVVMVAK
jgi:hypothetical protein